MYLNNGRIPGPAFSRVRKERVTGLEPVTFSLGIPWSRTFSQEADGRKPPAMNLMIANLEL
jgi:hypothetical protein